MAAHEYWVYCASLLLHKIKIADNPRTVQQALAEQRASYGALRPSIHNQDKLIPIEEQETIFQPFHRFQQTEGQDVKGRGFGLPIVRRIIEAHGGTIGVDSTEALGTTIVLTLPLDTRPFQNCLTLE